MDPSISSQHQKITIISNLMILPFPIIKRHLASALLSFLLLTILSSSFLSKYLSPFHFQSLSKFGGFLSQYLLPNKNVEPASCDYSNGRWVRDEASSSALKFYAEDCLFLDPGFRCQKNGRKDVEYRNWRWQPQGCELPRFDARGFLERSSNGRIVFAGDSIGRNQWESLVCMLAAAVSNKSSVYEANGKPITKHKGFLCIRFAEYNLTVEYYRTPYLVVPDRPPKDAPDVVKYAIRLDTMHRFSKLWKGADVLVFNDGHWWNADKTIKQGFYFQEGDAVNMTMSVDEAFKKSLQTWKKWVLDHLDRDKTYVVFRSYSPVHYRGGTWDEGGRCNASFAPETNYTRLEAEPWNNKLIYEAVKEVEGAYDKVQFLNITFLSEFRIDGHPSEYREPGMPQPVRQDCSHWCLPGVPDTWNEVMYANLLQKGFRITSENH
ncbi:unnamed protein product [Rhodiola kirilowii]